MLWVEVWFAKPLHYPGSDRIKCCFSQGIPRAHVLLQTHQGALLCEAVLLHPLQLPSGAEGQRAAARQEGNQALVYLNELSKRRRGPETKTCDDTQRAIHSAAIQES